MMVFKKRDKKTPARRRLSSFGSKQAARATETDLEQRYVFRRNRTLTGSLSSEVQSAKLHRMELRSPRVQGHDLKAHRRQLSGGLLVVLAMVCLLGYFVYESIAVPVIKAGNNLEVTDTKVYQDKIQAYLNAHPSERLRSTVNVQSLAAYLQSHGAPEVASVEPRLRFAGFGVSQLTLQFRRPVVVWQTNNHTFYVDADGNAFERNYYDRPDVQVVDKTGIPTSGNQVLASDRFLGFIGRLIGRMKTNDYTVTQIILPESTTRQVEVMVTQTSYPIKFSVDRSAGEQAEDAARAIRYLDGKGVVPEYLDVRVSGKAYYL